MGLWVLFLCPPQDWGQLWWQWAAAASHYRAVLTCVFLCALHTHLRSLLLLSSPPKAHLFPARTLTGRLPFSSLYNPSGARPCRFHFLKNISPHLCSQATKILALRPFLNQGTGLSPKSLASCSVRSWYAQDPVPAATQLSTRGSGSYDTIIPKLCSSEASSTSDSTPFPVTQCQRVSHRILTTALNTGITTHSIHDTLQAHRCDRCCPRSQREYTTDLAFGLGNA